MKKTAYLLASAADRATMVNGCPLGKVAEATGRAIYGDIVNEDVLIRRSPAVDKARASSDERSVKYERMISSQDRYLSERGYL